MSNKYRKQKLPTEVKLNGHDYIFITCEGDRLTNAVGVFDSFKKARNHLGEHIKKRNKFCNRFSISVLPLDTTMENEPYFTVFYDDHNNPDGGWNNKIEQEIKEVFV
jgi:hypothetical protein